MSSPNIRSVVCICKTTLKKTCSQSCQMVAIDQNDKAGQFSLDKLDLLNRMVLAAVQYMTLITERSHHSLEKNILVSTLGYILSWWEAGSYVTVYVKERQGRKSFTVLSSITHYYFHKITHSLYELHFYESWRCGLWKNRELRNLEQ